MALVVLTSPDSDVALLTTVSFLQAQGIPCFVRGGGFGSLCPGPRIQGYNATTVRVPEAFLHEAQGLLAAAPIGEDFQDTQESQPGPGQ